MRTLKGNPLKELGTVLTGGGEKRPRIVTVPYLIPSVSPKAEPGRVWGGC